MAALVHDPALRDEPELLDAVTAAAAIALENARLHAELRARLEELTRLARAGHRGRPEGAAAAGAQPARRRAAAARRAVARAGPARDGGSAATPRRARALDQAAGRDRDLPRGAPRRRRGIHPAVVSGHGLEVALEQLAARAPRSGPADGRPSTDGCPRRSRWPPTTSSRESLANIGKHAQATRGERRGRTSRTASVVLEVVDDGVGGADTERGTRSARPRRPRRGARAARLRVWSPSGGGTRLERRSHARRDRRGQRAAPRGPRAPARRQRASTSSAPARPPTTCCCKVRSYSPDVAIVDIRLPPTHNDEGLRAALEIRARYPSVGRPRALPVRRARAGDEAPGRLSRGRRLPAQGSHQRRARSSSRRCAGSPAAARRRPDHRLHAAVRSAAATIRSPS